MPSYFWVDDDGTYYTQTSTTEIISENGKYLFRQTVVAPPEPETGNPIGLLLSLTYTV